MRKAVPGVSLLVLGFLMSAAAVLGIVGAPSHIGTAAAQAAQAAQPATSYRAPAGWETVTFDGVALSMPSRWKVVSGPCTYSRTGMVSLGLHRYSSSYSCPAMLLTAPLVELFSASDIPPLTFTGSTKTVHGLALDQAGTTAESGTFWEIRSLGLVVVSRGKGAMAVVDTLRPVAGAA